MPSPEPAIPQRLLRHSIGLHCTECHAVVPAVPRDLLSALVAEEAVHCPACEARYDVWKRLVEQLEFGAFGSRYAAVGASIVAAEIQLQRDQLILIDFQRLGIPETAQIEEIAMTAIGPGEGFLHPVFLKASDPGESASSKQAIYPIPMDGGAERSKASILVIWRPAASSRDPAQDALLAGVRAAHRRDHLGAIMSSNAAMELALGSAMNGWLEHHGIGRERREQFLGSVATYGPQLSVLLPVAAATVGRKPIPEPAQAALARLRRLRNNVAHEGLQGTAVTDADIAQCIAGAAVGVVYCEALLATLA